MSNPTVSVVIPVYNTEKYLRQCLDSVVNQTLQDIEIICIDNCSTDSSASIIDEYAVKDSRIVVLKQQQNMGYGNSLNKGIALARGEYIGIVESDDWIENVMYEKLYGIAKQHDVEIVKSCFYENIDTKNYKSIVKVQWSTQFDLPSNVFAISEYPGFFCVHPSIWTCLYKKDFLDIQCIRFTETLGSSWQDNIYQVKTLCLAKKIVYTNDAYYYYRKTYLDDSVKLPHFTLPFDCATEIHTWLEQNQISNQNILAYLYKKEFYYIQIALQKIGFCNFISISPLISAMITRMNKKIIEENTIITYNERNFFSLVKHHLFYIFFKEKVLKKSYMSRILKKIYHTLLPKRL